MATVFVLRRGDQYWQDHPVAAWGFLASRYTQVWKTRRGIERFLEKNPGVARESHIEEVSENAPKANWRGQNSTDRFRRRRPATKNAAAKGTAKVAVAAAPSPSTTAAVLSDRHVSCPSHCCALHGCKYGLDDCPVAGRVVYQEHICEQCEDAGIENVDQARARAAGAMSRKRLADLIRHVERVGVNPALDAFVRRLHAEARVPFDGFNPKVAPNFAEPSPPAKSPETTAAALADALRKLADKVDETTGPCDHKRASCESIGCIGVEVRQARTALLDYSTLRMG